MKTITSKRLSFKQTFATLVRTQKRSFPAVRETATSSASDQSITQRFTDTHVQDIFDIQAEPPGPSFNYCCKPIFTELQ